MSISAVSQNTPALNISHQSPALNAIASSLDAASQMTQLMNGLLMNLLRSAQQATAGQGNPSIGGPSQSGLGGLGGLGGAGGLGGLLQSFAQLLQSMTPLLQALGNGGLGANGPASQLAGGLGGGLGASPLAQAGGQLGAAAGHALGGAPGAQVGGAIGAAAGNALAGAVSHTATPPGAAPLAQAGSQIGAAVGNAVAGAPGAQVGAAVGAAAGAALGAATGTPAAATPTFTPNAVNTSATLGNMTPDAARQWALANGGDNMTAKDVQQGVALYSIFNTGSNRL
ncbi:MAG TPA: hypothetical protein VIN58_20395 [Roseateles sp.]